MVLGLYYITKQRKGAKGEGITFYSAEEAIIAFNEKAVDLHAIVKVKVDDVDQDGNLINHIIETTVGRVILNQNTPRKVGFLNTIITKKALRDIIGHVYKVCGVDVTAKFLDDIKDLGYRKAFEGGLSFNLADVIIPAEKDELVQDGLQSGRGSDDEL